MSERRRPPYPRRERDDVPPYGDAGRPFPQRRPHPARYSYNVDDSTTATGGRFAGVLLALAVAALVLTHALWQVTAPGPAGRIFRAVLPPLTDLDQTLAANRDAIREIGAGLPADGRMTVPGLPMRVELTRTEALSEDPAALRALVLTRMSETLYRQGVDAFRAPDAPPRTPSLLSSQWALRGTLNALTAERHAALRTPRLVAAALTLVLAALTIWLQEGPARLLAPGASVIIGALLAGLAALAARLFVFLFFGSEDVVDGVVRMVVRDAAMTVLFAAGPFLAFGVAVTGLGLLARRWDQAEPAPVPVRHRQPVRRQRGE